MNSNQQPQSGYPQFTPVNYQPQPGVYYTQDPNTGAQQIYYTQPQVQYVQQQIPQIQKPQFMTNPNCPRCHGSGFDGRKKKPCKICTAASGVCYKCTGSGTTRKGKPCTNCAYHSNAGVCPACTLKKALNGKNNKPCLVCKTIQRVKY